jgi:hypothetical protein
MTTRVLLGKRAIALGLGVALFLAVAVNSMASPRISLNFAKIEFVAAGETVKVKIDCEQGDLDGMQWRVRGLKTAPPSLRVGTRPNPQGDAGVFKIVNESGINLSLNLGVTCFVGDDLGDP